jgi:hypothetical protein
MQKGLGYLAVAATRVGSGVVDEAGVEGWIRSAPIEVVVILGAVALLQQLFRSFVAWQQYAP